MLLFLDNQKFLLVLDPEPEPERGSQGARKARSVERSAWNPHTPAIPLDFISLGGGPEIKTTTVSNPFAACLFPTVSMEEPIIVIGTPHTEHT